MTTSSSATTPLTPGPTAETTPAPSEPRTTGSFALPPRTIHQSRRLSAAATRSTQTWPGPGSGSGRSVRMRPSGPPKACSSTARTAWDDSPMRADVAVVGAGLFGTSIAFQLARAGASVVLVERDGVCAGDSGLCFSMGRRHYSNEVTARLAMRGVEIIKAWAEEVGSGDSGYVRTGYMMTADAERLPAIEENVARLVSWGLDTRVVSPREIAEIEPLLSLDGGAGGAYEPDGGFADAQKMTLSWLAAGLLHGVVPMVGARFTWIRVAGGRVRGLDTDRGPVEAGVVVNAAGGWGGALSRSAGVELPISLRRVQVAFVRQPADRPQARLTFSDMVSNLVLRPDRAGIALVVAYQAEQLRSEERRVG